MSLRGAGIFSLDHIKNRMKLALTSSGVPLLLSMLVGIALIARADVDTGLIASWKLNEGNGTTVNDSSGNGLNGVFGGATLPQWTTGQNSAALQFDGQTSQVSVAHNPLLNPTQVSIAFWVKTLSYIPNNNGSLLQKGGTGGYRIRCSSSNAPCRPQFIFNYLIGASGAGLPLNEWHHVAITADSTGSRVFIDGLLSGSNSQPYVNSNPSGALVIGGSADPSMILYDVRLYNRSLTATDVVTLYQLGSIPPAPDLTAPTVALTTPLNNAIVSGSVVMSANASDPLVSGQSTSGISKVTFVVDGAVVGEDLSGPYSVAWDSKSVADGSHQLTATAADKAGNTGTSAPIAITVDNTGDHAPPVISNGKPTGTLPPQTTSATMSVVTDENAVCKYGLVPGSVYDTLPNTFGTTGGTSHSTALDGLVSGASYRYYVRCRDQFGNANTSDAIVAFSISTASTGLADGLLLHLTFDNNGYSDTSSLSNTVSWPVPNYAPGVGGVQNANDTAAMTAQAFLEVKPNSALSGMSALTYSVWVKKNVPTAYEWMLENSGSYYLLLTTQGYVKAGVFSVDSTTTTQYYTDIISYYQGNNTDWNFYAVVFDGAQYKLYINGVGVATKTCSSTNCLGLVLSHPTYPVIIAGRRPNQYFNGAIDDVRIYNRVLSDSEVGQLYSLGNR